MGKFFGWIWVFVANGAFFRIADSEFFFPAQFEV
jgi:hypothetical protein